MFLCFRGPLARCEMLSNHNFRHESKKISNKIRDIREIRVQIYSHKKCPVAKVLVRICRTHNEAALNGQPRFSQSSRTTVLLSPFGTFVSRPPAAPPNLLPHRAWQALLNPDVGAAADSGEQGTGTHLDLVRAGRSNPPSHVPPIPDQEVLTTPRKRGAATGR